MTKDTMTEEEPMVTDKERREAARELRGYGFDVLKDGSLLSTLKDVTGRSCWRDCLIALADLIDRPTCHICETDHEFEGSVRCDRCRMTFMRPWEPFKYCPECGARVVTDDE